MNWWLVLGAINGFLAIAAGAIGAHALAGRLDARDMKLFETAAYYQLAHALALLAVAWLAERSPGQRLPGVAGMSFLLGILLFSGSLYAIGLTGYRSFAPLAPFGGVCLLLGWLLLGACAWRR